MQNVFTNFRLWHQQNVWCKAKLSHFLIFKMMKRSVTCARSAHVTDWLRSYLFYQVYSVCKFNFSKIHSPFTLTKRVRKLGSNFYFSRLVQRALCLWFFWAFLQINGQWKGISAGGCGNYKDSYKHNPIYQFNLEKSGPLLIELRGSRCALFLFNWN